MGCGCRAGRARLSQNKALWIPEGGSVDGEGTIEYKSEMMAQAKVMRRGGTYIVEGDPIPRTVKRRVAPRPV